MGLGIEVGGGRVVVVSGGWGFGGADWGSRMGM